MTGAHPQVAAATAGMDLRDRAAPAAEIQARSRPDSPDDDGLGAVFEDRAVRLGPKFGGAGVLNHEWAAMVTAVLGRAVRPRARRMTAAMSSDITMHSKGRCGGWDLAS